MGYLALGRDGSKSSLLNKAKVYLIPLFDEIDIAPQVDPEPDDRPDCGVHALGVAAAGEDGDSLPAVGVAADKPTARAATHFELLQQEGRINFVISAL